MLRLISQSSGSCCFIPRPPSASRDILQESSETLEPLSSVAPSSRRQPKWRFHATFCQLQHKYFPPLVLHPAFAKLHKDVRQVVLFQVHGSPLPHIYDWRFHATFTPSQSSSRTWDRVLEEEVRFNAIVRERSFRIKGAFSHRATCSFCSQP